MAHEDLWQNEHFRKAFQRWWDEDWSWDGLATKYRRANLGSEPDEALGTLQDVWLEEEGNLIRFAGRRWTPFHLPPFDRDGNACPAQLWTKAKDPACAAKLHRRLDAAVWPDESVLKKVDLHAVTEFADLQGVVFPREFELSGDVLVADFQSAIFISPVAFHEGVLARFNGVTFSGDAGFDGASFSANTHFDGTTFSTFARFDDATFSGEAWFVYATFAGYVGFGGATFSGNALFDKATFSGDARFGGAAFASTASFYDVMFYRNASFVGATFSNYVLFSGATFCRTARFGGTTPFARAAAFKSVHFGRGADFSGREFREATDFSSTRFSGVPKFHGAKLHADTSFQNVEFRDGISGRALPRRRLGWFDRQERDRDKRRRDSRMRLKAYLRYRRVPLGLRHFALREVRQSYDADAEEYEIAYRQLRRLCAEIGGIEYEGLFHALELRAHRARTDTNPTARFASWLYDVLSDYGRSMGRPLIALLGAWTFFATAYLLLLTPPYSVGGPNIVAETCQNMAWPSRAELWTASAREFLPSLFGMSSVSNRPEWLRCAEGNHQLLFFVLSVAQAMTFIACVSLFLLALRPRFQLKD